MTVWGVLPFEPVSDHTSSGSHAADLDSFASPAFMAVEDRPGRPANFAILRQADDT